MKAIISTKYGGPDVLQLQEVAKPTPKVNEVLIKVYTASVTTAGSMMRTGYPLIGRLFMGLTKPNNPIPGTGFGGKIEAVGHGVTKFKIGDFVFGESIVTFGTQAEYLCIPEDGIILTKPANMTFEAAAAVCDGALTSLSFLKDIGEIKTGQKVLINGASGSLGTAAVQLAKHFGAEVTGVCSSKNVELVKKLGADHVIDYTQIDFTENGQTYDLIYDTIGKSSFAKCKKILTQDGAYLSPVLDFSLLLKVLWTSIFGKKKAKFSATGIRPVPELKVLFKELKQLFAEGYLTTVMDKSYALAQISDAHRYIDKGHKKGNVVISIIR